MNHFAMKLGTIALALGLASSTTVAADGSYSHDWSGGFAGVHLGYGWANSDWAFQNEFNFNEDFFPGSNFSQRLSGVLGGAHAGYQIQRDRYVFGIEVTYARSGIDDDKRSPIKPAVQSTEIDWYSTAALRLGISSGDRHYYIKGGYAFGDVTIKGAFDTNVVAGLTFEDTSRHDGFVVGAGFEQKFGERYSVGLDYSYIDLGESRHSGIDSFMIPFEIDAETKVHAIAVRFSAHF